MFEFNFSSLNPIAVLCQNSGPDYYQNLRLIFIAPAYHNLILV